MSTIIIIHPSACSLEKISLPNPYHNFEKYRPQIEKKIPTTTELWPKTAQQVVNINYCPADVSKLN